MILSVLLLPQAVYRGGKMQKAILFFLIVLVSTTFLSCSKVKAFEGSFQTARTKLLDKLSVSTTKDNKEIAGKIVEGIKEKDVAKIKSLFSKQSLAEMPDIDNQIKQLIEFVNKTNINEYEIKNGFEGMSREYGVTEKLSRKCFVYYPNYESRKFRMNISYYKINLNEPDLEGVVSIEFYQQEKYNEPVEIIIIGNRRV